MPKKQVRFRSQPSSSKPSSSSFSSSASSASSIPPPFTRIPSSAPALAVWTSILDESKIYITHIDNHAVSRKKLIFYSALLLNLGVVGIIAWRANIVLFQHLLGTWRAYSKTGSIEGYIYKAREKMLGLAAGQQLCLKPSCWPMLAFNVLSQMLLWTLEYYCFTFFLRMAFNFFIRDWRDYGNPFLHRFHLGFKPREVIVRASKTGGWLGQRDLLNGGEDQISKRGEDSPFWRTKILTAVNAEVLATKSGYVLQDADWELDFGGMVAAEEMIIEAKNGRAVGDEDGLTEGEVNGWVFGFVEGVGWVRWGFRDNVFRAAAASSSSSTSTLTSKSAEKSESGQGEVVGDVDEGRKMVQMFREQLEKIGKEDLFFKWVELIQYESSRPGGFTKERQEEAGKKVKELFDRYGVDFDKFQQDVGIVDGKLIE